MTDTSGTTDTSVDEAAILAGWDPRHGPAPFVHAMPPAIDPALGNNGVPAPVPGDHDYTGGPA